MFLFTILYEYLRRVSKRAYPVPALVDVPRRKRLDPAKNVTKLREAVSTSKHGGRPDKKAKYELGTYLFQKLKTRRYQNLP